MSSRKTEGKLLPGDIHKRKDNVKRGIGLDQDRYRWRVLVNSVMNLRASQNTGKLPSGCTTCGLSSGTQLHRVS
jgi:hypothetical protein